MKCHTAVLLVALLLTGSSTIPACTSTSTNSTTSGRRPSESSPSTHILWSTWWVSEWASLSRTQDWTWLAPTVCDSQHYQLSSTSLTLHVCVCVFLHYCSSPTRCRFWSDQWSWAPTWPPPACGTAWLCSAPPSPTADTTCRCCHHPSSTTSTTSGEQSHSVCVGLGDVCGKPSLNIQRIMCFVCHSREEKSFCVNIRPKSPGGDKMTIFKMLVEVFID